MANLHQSEERGNFHAILRAQAHIRTFSEASVSCHQTIDYIYNDRTPTKS